MSRWEKFKDGFKDTPYYLGVITGLITVYFVACMLSFMLYSCGRHMFE